MLHLQYFGGEMCVVLEQSNWQFYNETMCSFQVAVQVFLARKNTVGLCPLRLKFLSCFFLNKGFNPRFLTDKVLLVATEGFIIHLGKTTFTGLTILAPEVLARLIHRVDDGVK